MTLPDSFYQRSDVVQIARELLGKVIITEKAGITTSAMITETEAYAGVTDKASHAWGGRRTQRTEVMYAAGGVAYVYLCYGIHHLFNVVTYKEDIPHAVLIRAAAPLEGTDKMLERRGHERLTPALTAGPGSMSMALGIYTSDSGVWLQGAAIRLEDRGIIIPEHEIVATPRIGVAYAGEDAYLPYRFYIKGNPYVSKGKYLKQP